MNDSLELGFDGFTAVQSTIIEPEQLPVFEAGGLRRVLSVESLPNLLHEGRRGLWYRVHYRERINA